MLEQIKYLFKFKSSLLYKIWYTYSSFIKLLKLFLFKKFDFTNFPFKWDFVIENSIWKFKIYEPSDMHSVLNPNSEKDLLKYFQMNWWIFLDIWTNVWKYSIIVWKQSKENIIYWFEPNIYLFNNYLVKNIELNSLTNINLVNKWLSNEKWEFVLIVPENNFWSWSIENKFKWWKEYKIELIKLDDFIFENNIKINDIKLIKIDVEWHEHKTLLWAKEVLSKLQNCRLIIEIFEKSEHFKETIELIKSFWFELEDKLYWDNYIFYKN